MFHLYNLEQPGTDVIQQWANPLPLHFGCDSPFLCNVEMCLVNVNNSLHGRRLTLPHSCSSPSEFLRYSYEFPRSHGGLPSLHDSRMGRFVNHEVMSTHGPAREKTVEVLRRRAKVSRRNRAELSFDRECHGNPNP